MAKYIKWFKELSKKDIGIVGGKGANLGELWNAGFPVPPGFVVTAQAYEHFLEANKLWPKISEMLDSLNIEDTEQLQRKAADIQSLIKKSQMPQEIMDEICAAYSCLDANQDLIGIKSAEQIINIGRDPAFVAVRSSATAEDLPQASFAGQQATFLNVKGKEALLDAVKACWASLREPYTIVRKITSLMIKF